MKKILSLLLIIFFAGCEDKVNIPLETASPKLVVEANILWQKGTDGSTQKIKLTTTTDYYSNVIPVVSGATVYITNSSDTVFTFTETPNTGEYVCTDFVPAINESYTLTIKHDGQIYNSTEKLLATPTIDSFEQTAVQGFDGDLIQVKLFFQDNGLEDNNYLIGVKNSNLVIPEYGVQTDEFSQGNQMFGFYTNDKLKAGDHLDFILEGISTRYYNYMNKLLNVAGGGGPFATPPATLRGNIINVTNSNNYPLGYFHLSEADTKNYVIQ